MSEPTGGTVKPDRYVWDWVDENGGSYVVRKPDGSILCRTGRYKKGYEEAQAIAEGMNTAEQLGRSDG